MPGLQCQREHSACTLWFICWLAPSTLWGPAWTVQTPPSTPMLYGLDDLTFLLQGFIWNWRSLCSVCPYTFVVARFCAQHSVFAALNICIFLQRIISTRLHVVLRLFGTESLLIFIIDSNELRSLFMFLRNSVRLQCTTERYCCLVHYFMFRRLLLEIYVCRTSAGIASTAIDSPVIHIACVPLST